VHSSSNRLLVVGLSHLLERACVLASLLTCFLVNTRTRVRTQAGVARSRRGGHRRTRPRRQHGCAPRGGGACSCLDSGI
jgi:hypothetical protein